MSVNTKAFIKTIRPAAIDSGVVSEVKRALTSRFGLQFQESVYQDGRYRKQFKLAPGYPTTLNTEQVRAAASGIPGGYGNLRRAVENALNGADVVSATGNQNVGDVNTDEFVALVKQYADRYEWCSSAEDAVSDAFDGLEFSDSEDLVLVGTYPQTLNREDVYQFVVDARQSYSGTTGVDDLLNEITNRWLDGEQANTQNTRPNASRNGQYRVTIDTTLTTEQLRHLGWNGTSSLTGLPVRYNGINGRITTASNA